MNYRPHLPARQRALLATVTRRLEAGELTLPAALALRDRIRAGEQPVPPTWPTGAAPALPLGGTPLAEGRKRVVTARPPPATTRPAARRPLARERGEREVLELLRERPRPVAALARACGLSTAGVYLRLKPMRADGRVYCVTGPNRLRIYHAADAGPPAEPEAPAATPEPVLVVPKAEAAAAARERLEAVALDVLADGRPVTAPELATRARMTGLEALGALERLASRGTIDVRRPEAGPGVFRAIAE